MMDDDDANRRAASAKKGSPFLNTAQAAHYLGLGERTLVEWRGEGVGPTPRRHGRFVRYHIDDLDAWSKGEREAFDPDRPQASGPRHV
ncbi:helix-turn-helix domain-containing protein [Caulobacter sp. LARHSG274]